MGYRIIIPPADEPITLGEAKAHLRVFVADDDALILGYVKAARCALEARLNRVLMPQVVEAAVYQVGDTVFPVLPARGVISISYTDTAGVVQPLDPSYYVFAGYSEPPWLGPSFGSTWPAAQTGTPYVIRYEAGYEDADSVPAALKQWILLALGAFYEQRSAVVAGVSVSPLPEDFMHWLWHPYMVYA